MGIMTASGLALERCLVQRATAFTQTAKPVNRLASSLRSDAVKCLAFFSREATA